MKRKLLVPIIFIVVIVLTIIGVSYTQFISSHIQINYPDIETDLTLQDVGLELHREQELYDANKDDDNALNYYKTISSIEKGNKEEAIDILKQLVREEPENLLFSNELRGIMDKQRFIDFAKDIEPRSTNLQIQIGLAYIDQLQNESLGTASLGQISAQSIEVFDAVHNENEYHFLALFARGLNNLYWPSGLGRAEQAVEDLAYTVSISSIFEERYDTILWPMAYEAYGDALVKAEKIDEGYQVWAEGLNKYPDYSSLQKRVNAGQDSALNIVEEERGLDDFQRPDPSISDLSKIFEE